MKQLLYTPSADQRERVLKFARSGATEDDIAAQFDIPVKRLKKLFRKELRCGEAEGKQLALDKLLDVVREGSNISGLIFWIKARCGWRDTGNAGTGPTYINSILEIKCEGSS